MADVEIKYEDGVVVVGEEDTQKILPVVYMDNID